MVRYCAHSGFSGPKGRRESLMYIDPPRLFYNNLLRRARNLARLLPGRISIQPTNRVHMVQLGPQGMAGIGPGALGLVVRAELCPSLNIICPAILWSPGCPPESRVGMLWLSVYSTVPGEYLYALLCHRTTPGFRPRPLRRITNEG